MTKEYAEQIAQDFVVLLYDEFGTILSQEQYENLIAVIIEHGDAFIDQLVFNSIKQGYAIPEDSQQLSGE